ncbi:hypothetical protein CRUP_029971 [Coryphaenoides rupestris]|nr:hypothetical protein CRUP_029971 [Coryphaenoides rupestris]
MASRDEQQWSGNCEYSRSSTRPPLGTRLRSGSGPRKPIAPCHRTKFDHGAPPDPILTTLLRPPPPAGAPRISPRDPDLQPIHRSNLPTPSLQASRRRARRRRPRRYRTTSPCRPPPRAHRSRISLFRAFGSQLFARFCHSTWTGQARLSNLLHQCEPARPILPLPPATTRARQALSAPPGLFSGPRPARQSSPQRSRDPPRRTPEPRSDVLERLAGGPFDVSFHDEDDITCQAELEESESAFAWICFNCGSIPNLGATKGPWKARFLKFHSRCRGPPPVLCQNTANVELYAVWRRVLSDGLRKLTRCLLAGCTDSLRGDLLIRVLDHARPSWESSPWTACSMSCGGGVQSRAVSCVEEDMQGTLTAAEEWKWSCDLRQRSLIGLWSNKLAPPSHGVSADRAVLVEEAQARQWDSPIWA